jgi:fructose-1,6-bisphosphatase
MDLRSGWVCYVGYGPKDHLLGTFDEYMTAQLSELVANEKYIRFTESTRQNEGYVADWTHAIARFCHHSGSQAHDRHCERQRAICWT